jgi:hypothetical protein
VTQALHDLVVRRRQQQQLDVLVRVLEPLREPLDDAQRDLWMRPSITSSRDGARVTAVAERGRPFRIAISPKKSPVVSTARTCSVSPTLRRISTCPDSTTYICPPGCPSSNSTVPAVKS